MAKKTSAKKKKLAPKKKPVAAKATASLQIGKTFGLWNVMCCFARIALSTFVKS